MKKKDDSAILMGHPIWFEDVCKVYPPTLNDVLSNENYGRFVSLFTISQEDIWDNLAKEVGDIPEKAPTPFQQLMIICLSSKEASNLIKEGIEFFIQQPVTIRAETGIIFLLENVQEAEEIQDLKVINEDNYFEFQNTIRRVIGEEEKEAPAIDDNPHVRRIKAKARERERLIQRKGKTSSISLGQMLVALSCMNVGFKLLKEYGEISYPAIFRLFEMAQNKEQYQADIQLISGGMLDTRKIKPKNWIRAD